MSDTANHDNALRIVLTILGNLCLVGLLVVMSSGRDQEILLQELLPCAIISAWGTVAIMYLKGWLSSSTDTLTSGKIAIQIIGTIFLHIASTAIVIFGWQTPLSTITTNITEAFPFMGTAAFFGFIGAYLLNEGT